MERAFKVRSFSNARKIYKVVIKGEKATGTEVMVEIPRPWFPVTRVSSNVVRRRML